MFRPTRQYHGAGSAQAFKDLKGRSEQKLFGNILPMELNTKSPIVIDFFPFLLYISHKSNIYIIWKAFFYGIISIFYLSI